MKRILCLLFFIGTFSQTILCDKAQISKSTTTTASEVGGKTEISPVFRRKPIKLPKATTTALPDIVRENVNSSEEDDNGKEEYRVGVEHYLDVGTENDKDILEDLEEISTNNHSSELEEKNVEEEEPFYDNDDYYYEEEYDEKEEEYYRRKQEEEQQHQQQRIKELGQRRRQWLQKQRQRYYESLSRWRRPASAKVVIPDRPPRLLHPHQRPPIPQQHHTTENRRHYEAIRSRDHRDNGESTSLMRSLLGVDPFCIHDDAQFSCTFTPLCWMQGGVAMGGCDSMLYSCCVSHTIARRKDTFVETGRAQKRRHKEILHNEPECGVTKHRQFAKRIIGGQKAKFAELPWQVHIRISSYQCGGVLLNHQYVATAAHCVHQAKLSQITVHLGEYDTKNTKQNAEPLDSESFRVDHITLHPDFRYMLTQPDRYDVAVLKLDRPVEYHDNILPICLPTADTDLVGKIGVVAGWGKTDNSFGKTGTNVLHKVLVPIIDNQRCRAWHRDKAIAVQLHDEMFCAGHKEGKQDACLGDSGGPLVINFDGKWTLIGITSAGFGCAVEKQPGIYHKVSKTAKWLSTIINKDSPRR